MFSHRRYRQVFYKLVNHIPWVQQNILGSYLFMESGTKIAIGAVATLLLAWGAHGPFHHGGAFMNMLEGKAKAALSEKAMAGVSVASEHDPALKRVIVLSGQKTDAEKKAAIDLVEAIPGVAKAIWADGGAPVVAAAAIPAPPAKVETPASAAVIAECQQDINALMAGKTINFQSGSAYLAQESAVVIDELAKALAPCAGTQVEVQGHTDLIGNAEINQKLSQARAESVANALVAKGIPAARLTPKGYGATQPVENARTAEANAKNRRTIFSVAAADAAPKGE